MGKVGQLGIPRVGKAVRRERLLSAMAAGERQVVALVAPVGFGKTTLAADFVSRVENDAIWVGFNGAAIECGEVLLRIAEQLESVPLSDIESSNDLTSLAQGLAERILRPSTLVLDDLASNRDGGQPGLSELLRILRPLFDRILLTMHEVSADELLALQDALVLDRQHLALTQSELLAILELKGLDPSAYGHADELLKETGGNAGFAALLLESCGSAADFGTIGPHVSTQAMLEASLFSHEAPEDAELISYACMLGECTFGELQLMGLRSARERLLSISRRIPLIRVARTATSAVGNVQVHHLVSQCVLYQMRSGRRPAPPLNPVLDMLVERSDWRRATDLVAILGSDEVIVSFVERHGRSMIENEQAANLLRLMSYTSPASVLGSARALLHWAQALHLKGDLDESLAKVAAAHALASHSGDHVTCALAACERSGILVRKGRASEAVELTEHALRQCRDKLQGETLCELLMENASALAMTGRAQEAAAALQDARGAAVGNARTAARVESLSVELEVAATGDWESAVSRLSPLCDAGLLTGRLLARCREDLALALAQTGRLERASSVLEAVGTREADPGTPRCGTASALAASGRADYPGSVEALRDARRSAHTSCDSQPVEETLLFQSAVERAAGDLRRSLASAERASERLATSDCFGPSRLAAVEVAASHASLRDYSKALDWLEKASEGGNGPNQYECLCHAAIAAVVANRMGGLRAPRLAEMSPFISSGSAAWRLAMYCRAFPELLGILAVDAGVEALPGRLLDMLSIDGAQACLEASAQFVSDGDRDRLATRLLGGHLPETDEASSEEPSCSVGFFGGLTVEVGGRRVGDRDWGKRKARQLFAMLVARRGHEIPRDQILEHLWPELDDERAKNNFYVAWSSMKAALATKGQSGGCAFAESKHGRCRARVSAVSSELDDFDELVRQLRRAVEHDEPDAAQQAVERLATLYRGEFLPGDLYDDWFEQVRVDYRGQFVAAMTLAAEYLLAKDRCARALVCAGRVLGLDPLREDLYQLAMRAHLKLGQRNGAIEMFTRCRTNLSDELGLDPSDETLRLYQCVLDLGD